MALMGGILGGVALLALLLRIFDTAAILPGLMGIAGLGITGTLVTLIILRDGRRLGHCGLPLLVRFVLRGQRAANREGFWPIFRELHRRSFTELEGPAAMS
ncbi:hypothetical protein CQ14_33330 [Bradyrhizobium lablabi]|uniref:Uncharacterized protein n=1 Tax=Bradyrhizobium lablabi TaxID=722472 RepID=A0A0R3M8U2_9BRAD|nr:hypothetical protein CQ14_33330 [Bradyrhizobium lablabi]